MADAQFVIDITAGVSGATATTAQVDKVADSMMGVGVNATAFDDALAKLSGDLAAAKSATAEANSALAEGRSRYSELEQAAIKTSKQVERLEQKSKKDARSREAAQKEMISAQGRLDAALSSGAGEGEIKKLEAATEKAAKSLERASRSAVGLRAAKASASSAASAISAYSGTLSRLEKEAKQAAAAQGKLETQIESVGRVQKRVNDRLGDAATNLSTFRGALGDIGGPVAEFGERLMFPAQAFVDLNEKFGRSTAIATVAGFGLVRVVTAAATAFAAVTAAIGAAVIGLGVFALKASNAARSLRLNREAAEILTPALKGIPWGDITDSTGLAEDQLRSLSMSLVDAKISAADMPTALEAIAKAEAVLGSEGAKKFAADMLKGKEAVEAFSRRVDSELGDNLAKRMLSAEAQGGRFKRSLSRMFGDFDVEPALEGLSALVGLFDETSSTGKLMKAALTGLLDPIISNAKAAAYVVEAFVIGFAIGMTKLYIKAKPLVDKVGELLGIDTSGWTLDKILDKAAAAGEFLAPVVAAIGVGLLMLGGIVLGAAAAIVGLNAAFWKLNTAIGASLVAAYEAVSGFVEVGASIVAGIVSGITSGASKVIAAIIGVAKGAIAAAKSALGIASPSKVFEGIGANTGAGMAKGVDKSSGEVEGSIDNTMHAAVRTAVRSSDAAVSTVNNSSSTSTTNSPTIVIQKVEFPGGADAVAAFRQYLEGLALQGAQS